MISLATEKQPLQAQKPRAVKFRLVETVESRTPPLITGTISKDTSYTSYPSRVWNSGFPEVWDPVKLESNPLNLIPRLLDQIIALRQTAQQLRHALSDNGNRPEKLSEIAKQLVEGGEHAP